MDWRNLTLKEIAAALVLLALLAAFALRWALFPNFPGGPNNGFGSEWECTPQPKGDPICIKRLPK